MEQIQSKPCSNHDVFQYIKSFITECESEERMNTKGSFGESYFSQVDFLIQSNFMKKFSW